jgi:hypothetical protein
MKREKVREGRQGNRKGITGQAFSVYPCYHSRCTPGKKKRYTWSLAPLASVVLGVVGSAATFESATAGGRSDEYVAASRRLFWRLGHLINPDGCRLFTRREHAE